MLHEAILKEIRQIPDFPKPGILFYDIGTLIANKSRFNQVIKALATLIKDDKPDVLAAVESRGFIFAAPLAIELGCSLVMIRKPGKLPGKTYSQSYNLEYGEDKLELQADILQPNQKVVIMDDVLATGGTLAASAKLLAKQNIQLMSALVMLEITALNGRDELEIPIQSLLKV